VREKKPDLVVMGGTTGGDSVYKKALAGTTLQKVAKAAPCPVLAVAREAASFWGGFSSIVFGADFSKASDAAFDFSLKMAREAQCELHLFHAVDVGATLMGKIMDQDTIEGQIRESLNRIRGRYVAKMGDFKNYTMEVWEGIPSIEIVKFARERNADLIVMAHHARQADLEDSPMGSTMEQVIMRAGCPVISVNRLPKA
jgi:nucleotide-binding universal stress UspA family protein